MADLFYPLTDSRINATRMTLPAVAVCATCPYQTVCAAEDAANVALHGGDSVFRVAAGRLLGRGKRESKGRPRGPQPGQYRKPIRHGTQGGYQAHLRRKETACAQCKAANARAQQGRDRTKRTEEAA